MSKRFIDTGLVDKEWFEALDPRLKSFWYYLLLKCDPAGVWDTNFGLASYQIGQPVSDEDLAAFGDRIRRLESGKYLLTTFIRFQYGNLSRKCNGHTSAIKAAEKHGLFDCLPEGFPKGSHALPGRVMDKDKDKDKDKDSVEGGVGETNSRKPEPCLCDVAQEIAVEYLAQVTRPSPDSRGDRSVTSGKAQKNITELLSRRGYTADQLRLAIDRRAEEVEHDVATKGKAFGVQLAANFFNPDEPNFLALLEDEWRGPGEEEPEPVLSAEESAKADAAYLIWREKQEAMQA